MCHFVSLFFCFSTTGGDGRLRKYGVSDFPDRFRWHLTMMNSLVLTVNPQDKDLRSLWAEVAGKCADQLGTSQLLLETNMRLFRPLWATRKLQNFKCRSYFGCHRSKPCVCSSLLLFTFWSLYLQVCPSPLLGCKPPGMPTPPSRQSTTNHCCTLVAHNIHSSHTFELGRSVYWVCIVLKPSGRFLGGNQGGTGSNGGPTVLRNKTTAPKNPTLRHICAREVWIFWMELNVLREQIWAVSLEGLSPVTLTKRISRETMILVLCGNLQEKATLNTTAATAAQK